MVEAQRLLIGARRTRVLTGEEPLRLRARTAVTLQAIDDLWSDYLAGGQRPARRFGVDLPRAANPLAGYIVHVHLRIGELMRIIDDEWRVRFEQARISGTDARQHGATWTYLTTDEPSGLLTGRIMRGLRHLSSGPGGMVERRTRRRRVTSSPTANGRGALMRGDTRCVVMLPTRRRH